MNQRGRGCDDDREGSQDIHDRRGRDAVRLHRRRKRRGSRVEFVVRPACPQHGHDHARKRSGEPCPAHRAHEPLLHHDGDPLRQWRAAYRPRLRAHRDRRDPAIHAPRRARDAVRHRPRRARPQGPAGGGARRRDAAGVRRRRRQAVRGDGRASQRARRRHRAHDGAAQRPGGAGDLGADGRQRRHLPVEIFRLVFGARRSLFRRRRVDRRP